MGYGNLELCCCPKSGVNLRMTYLYGNDMSTVVICDYLQWFVGGNAALIAQKIVTTFPETSVSCPCIGECRLV